MHHKKKQIDNYIKEKFPKKAYIKRKTHYLKKKQVFDFYWSELLIALFIIIMLLAVFVNSLYVSDYTPQSEEIKEVEINVDIVDPNLAGVYDLVEFPEMIISM